MLTGELAEILNLPQRAGYLVKVVAEGSPAWQAGVQGGDRTARINGEDIVVRGDIILAVAGVEISPGADAVNEIHTRLLAQPPGSTFALKILRAGKVLELTGRLP